MSVFPFFSHLSFWALNASWSSSFSFFMLRLLVHNRMWRKNAQTKWESFFFIQSKDIGIHFLFGLKIIIVVIHIWTEYITVYGYLNMDSVCVLKPTCYWNHVEQKKQRHQLNFITYSLETKQLMCISIWIANFVAIKFANVVNQVCILFNVNTIYCISFDWYT